MLVRDELNCLFRPSLSTRCAFFLFGSANDVAQLAQAYAWGGRYGGQQVFDKAILADYTRQQSAANRRGLGFDRPASPAAGNTASGASALRSSSRPTIPATWVER